MNFTPQKGKSHITEYYHLFNSVSLNAGPKLGFVNFSFFATVYIDFRKKRQSI